MSINPDPSISIGVKTFSITQAGTGNLWAAVAKELDSWLITNDQIIIRDITTTRPQSIREGLEAVMVTLLYEYPTFPGSGGFGHPYRVLFIDSLSGTGFSTFKEWYESNNIVNGLDDDRRIQFIIPTPAVRTGDIGKGCPFFAIYAENDLSSGTPSGDSARRQLGAGRADYLSVMIVEAAENINNGSFGGVIMYAPNGQVIDNQARGKNVFNGGGGFTTGNRSYAITDQLTGNTELRAILFRRNEC